MASQAIVAVSGAALAAVGAAVNLVAQPQPVTLSAERVWLRRGGFVGVLNGRSSGPVAAPPAPPAPAPAKTPSASGSKPIGGKPPGAALPAPFGAFPKHTPSKLPAPPA